MAQERRQELERLIAQANEANILPERLWRCSEALRAMLDDIPRDELSDQWAQLRMDFERLGEGITWRRAAIVTWTEELEALNNEETTDDGPASPGPGPH